MPAELDSEARRIALEALRAEVLSSGSFTEETLERVRQRLLDQARLEPDSSEALVARRAAEFCGFIAGGKPLQDLPTLYVAGGRSNP